MYRILILRFEIVAKPHVSRMFQFICCVVILQFIFQQPPWWFYLIWYFLHNKSKCRTKASSLYFFYILNKKKYWYLVYDKFHSVIFIMLFLDLKNYNINKHYLTTNTKILNFIFFLFFLLLFFFWLHILLTDFYLIIKDPNRYISLTLVKWFQDWIKPVRNACRCINVLIIKKKYIKIS